ncbi:MAG: hypothetical protein R2909_12875 [Gemmatimonadales bacterium]
MRTLSLVLAASFLAAPVAGQAPDFSGHWKLNPEQSDAPPARGGGGGPGGQRGRGMGMMPTELRVRQSKDQLTIDEQIGDQDRRLVYNLDGKESRTPGMRNSEVVSHARLDAGSLLIDGSMTFEGPNGTMKIDSKEVRTLSADGKTMTVVITTTTPRGEMTRKLVYDKQ